MTRDGSPAPAAQVTLTSRTLGRVQLPLRILVPGSKGRPLEVTMDAKSKGPDLLFGPEAAQVSATLPYPPLAASQRAPPHPICTPTRTCCTPAQPEALAPKADVAFGTAAVLKEHTYKLQVRLPVRGVRAGRGTVPR